MPASGPDQERYERPYSRGMAAGLILAVILLLLVVIPAPSGSGAGPSSASTMLGEIWAWLRDNKDSIGPLSQIISAAGVVVAAATFVKTQRTNRATWLFETSKEIGEKSVELLQGGWTDEAVKKVIIFYASVFPFYHLGLVDKAMWRPIEDEITAIIRHRKGLFRQWLGGSPPQGFPSTSNFDSNFVAYLRSLQDRAG